MVETMRNNGDNKKTENLALDYLIRLPEKPSGRNKAIILLHGVGSNEKDLFSLADQMPDEYFIIAPRGQFSMGAERAAWYEVDFSTGKPVINLKQELSSRELIRTFIIQIKEKHDIHEVYLGGFSQGAIMSYTVGLMHPDEVQGIIALSGRVLQEVTPLLRKTEYLKEQKVFVAHGIQDHILPIDSAREAKEFLESLEVQLTYNEYPTGHQISYEVLQKLNEWLQ